MKRFLVFSALALVLGSCASTPAPAPTVEAPAWYSDLASAYPEAQYLAFMGSGKNAQEARQDALNQLSNYFGMNVQTFSSGFENYLEKKMGDEVKSEYERKVSTTVKVTSSEKLFNVEYTQPFTPKAGETSVAAYLSKAKAAKTWENQIKPLAEKARLLVAAAKNSELSIAQRLSAWKAVQVLAALIPSLDKNYKMLKPSDAPDLDLGFTSADLISLKNELSGKAAIQVSLTGDESSRFNALLEDKLSKAGFNTGKGGLMKLTGQVVFTTSPGSYGLTNAQWQVELSLGDGNTQIFSLALSGNGGGSKPETAKTMAIKAAEKEVDAKFIPGLTEKFASYLE